MEVIAFPPRCSDLCHPTLYVALKEFYKPLTVAEKVFIMIYGKQKLICVGIVLRICSPGILTRELLHMYLKATLSGNRLRQILIRKLWQLKRPSKGQARYDPVRRGWRNPETFLTQDPRKLLVNSRNIYFSHLKPPSIQALYFWSS